MHKSTILLAFCLICSPVLSQVRWGGRTYSSRVCNSPNCQMCNSIQAGLNQQRFQQSQQSSYSYYQQPVYRGSVVSSEGLVFNRDQQPAQQFQGHYSPSESLQTANNPAQRNASTEVIDEALETLKLTPGDTLADYGCGDGRVLIRAAQYYGCYGVGIEIDKEMARKARANVIKAERDGEIPANSIQIVTGDVLEFDPTQYNVTAIYCYLYQEVLDQLVNQFEEVGLVVTPFHKPDGLEFVKSGDCWVYRQKESTQSVEFEQSEPLFIPSEQLDQLHIPSEQSVEWQLTDTPPQTVSHQWQLTELTPQDNSSQWQLTSTVAASPQITIRYYPAPYPCPPCAALYDWMQHQPWIKIKKIEGSKIPNWVTSYPTIHWKAEDGRWKKASGWHGPEVFIRWMRYHNPNFSRRAGLSIHRTVNEPESVESQLVAMKDD